MGEGWVGGRARLLICLIPVATHGMPPREKPSVLGIYLTWPNSDQHKESSLLRLRMDTDKKRRGCGGGDGSGCVCVWLCGGWGMFNQPH